tara:strand:- start:128 stop:406 length:279 start_codon:yes stop_codon:yes gene_type:complete
MNSIQTGRNKYKYKYLLECEDIIKKYCSVVDMLNDDDLKHLCLDRQRIYRLRKNLYSTEGKNKSALIKKGYNRINITDINEPRKTKIIKILC